MVSFTIASGVTEPGITPSTSSNVSGVAKWNLVTPNSSDKLFKLICLSSGKVYKKASFFWVLKNKFLHPTPSILGTFSFASSTVYTAGCSTF